MSLHDQLKARRDKLVSGWEKAILDTYPAEGGKFFANTGNKFANPVGATFHKSIASIFDILISDKALEEARSAIDGIVRIRAVQGFKPSNAVGFIFAIRALMNKELELDKLSDEQQQWLELNARIDQLALIALDQYMECREKVWKHKANTLYDRTHRLLEKNNLIQDVAQ